MALGSLQNNFGPVVKFRFRTPAPYSHLTDIILVILDSQEFHDRGRKMSKKRQNEGQGFAKVKSFKPSLSLT